MNVIHPGGGVDVLGPHGVTLRCALHAHTTESDGEMAPALLLDHYSRAGYDVLAFTDHWVRTDAVPRSPILAIPSSEINATLGGGRWAHVLGLGISADPSHLRRSPLGLAETIRWIDDNGGVTFVAHPYWSGLTPADFAGLQGSPLLGVEVFNTTCELQLGQGVARYLWDGLLTEGYRLSAIATDDCHHPGFDSGVASVMVRVSEASVTEVISALRERHFYSTTGPTFDRILVSEGRIEVACSPCCSITLHAGPGLGGRIGTSRLAYRAGDPVKDASGALVGAIFEPIPGAPFVRVEACDEKGGTAWTNPLPLP
jgi:hypothetical protein